MQLNIITFPLMVRREENYANAAAPRGLTDLVYVS